MEHKRIVRQDVAEYILDQWMYGVTKEYYGNAKSMHWSLTPFHVAEQALERYDHTVSQETREDIFRQKCDALREDNCLDAKPNTEWLIAAFHLYWNMVHPGETKEQIAEHRANYYNALNYAKS